MPDPKNPLEMSDEELLNMPVPEGEPLNRDNTPPADEAPADDAGATDADDDYDDADDTDEDDAADDHGSEDDANEGNDDNQDEDQDEDEDGNDADDAPSDAPDTDSADDVDDDDEDEGDDSAPKTDSEASEGDSSPDEGDDLSKENLDNSIDYKAEYEKVLAPFKANNKMIRVKNADEAIRLMQMGAHYNKKMTELKPTFRIVKMLENNKLLSEDKINFLIDLHNKDEGAIKQLIKDSGLDPLDVDVEKNTGYQPKNHSVSNKEIELEQVLDDISRTPTYDKTLDLLAKDFDDESKKALYDNPDDIRALNDQVANGIYDLITTEVERHRALGNLQGVSDIDAYRMVGTDMHNRGLFPGQQQQGNAQQTQNDNANAAPVPANKGKNNNSTLKSKRKAAAGTSSATKQKSKKVRMNPLNMTDEEFLKLQAP